MEEKASNAMLVAIVAVVAIVGLVMLYSGGLSSGDAGITGQAHTGVACADSDGGSMPNVAGAVHVGETWTADVCYTLSSIYEGTCSGGVMRRTVVPCDVGKTCASETITAFGRSLIAQRCAPVASPEICDNIDNDRNGVVDNGCDDDNDNYCDSGMAKAVGKTVTTCTATPAANIRGDDCNDNNANIRPGAVEICGNGIDEDCNGADLACPLPGVPETICDNIDNDADGLIDEGCDDDNDNFCDAAIRVIGYPTTCTFGGEDCNDNNAAINRGAVDDSCDGVDQNCDGGDGYQGREFCDGRDDNCDGVIDGTPSVPSICPTCTDSDGGNIPLIGGIVVQTDRMLDGSIRRNESVDTCFSSEYLYEFSCRSIFGGSQAYTNVQNCYGMGLRCVSAGSGAYCG